MTPINVVHSLHRALEEGQQGEALRRLFTEDAVTIEHPNAVNPAGGTTHLEAMLAASERGGQLLSQQSYDVTDAIESGETAILRLRWTGTVSRDLGPFTAGQQLVAHIAQFVTVKGDRVSRVETYDCYEPFQQT